MPKQEPTNRIRHGPLTWKKGDPILARDLTAMANQVFEVITGGRGIKITKMGNGIIVSSTAQAARGGMTGGAGVRFAKVLTLKHDYIECQFWQPESDTLGEFVRVAKPWMLRKAPFHGKTIAYSDGTSVAYSYGVIGLRLGTVGPIVETQRITPNYYSGEVLRVNLGATDLVARGIRLVWEDANTCGRFWARA